MRNKTLNIMAGLERRINRLIVKEIDACGFDSRLREANRYRDKMENWLAEEIDALCQKAGVD